MDELEQLKKDWKAKEKLLPRYGAEELYAMLLKKSHAIVKWILVISIIEFVVWTVLGFYMNDDKFWKEVSSIHLTSFVVVVSVLNYVIVPVFIWLFYKRYRAISVTDNAKSLMENILKTRRVVKSYILYQLIVTGVVSFVSFLFSVIYLKLGDQSVELSQWLIIVGVGILVVIIYVGVIWLFYKLLYGFFLRRLRKNHHLLDKIELQEE